MGAALTGFAEFRRDMKRLGNTEAKKIMRSALRAGANKLLKSVRRAAPVSKLPENQLGLPAGSLKSAFKTRSLGRKKGRVGVSVSIFGGSRPFDAQFGRGSFYPPYIEYGHFIGKRNEKVRYLHGIRWLKDQHGRQFVLRKIEDPGWRSMKDGTRKYFKGVKGHGIHYTPYRQTTIRNGRREAETVAQVYRTGAMSRAETRTGQVPPKPWFGRTYDSTIASIEGAIRIRLQKGLDDAYLRGLTISDRDGE